MTEYLAKSNSTLTFEVTKNEKTIGKLVYKSWFTFHVEIEISNSKYMVGPKGFWGTTIEVKEDNNVLISLRMNWKGNIIMQTHFNNIEKNFVFQHRGFFKESFVFTDENGTELLILKPNWKWNKVNYEYQITASDVFEKLLHKELLLLNALHCANYYILGIGC